MTDENTVKASNLDALQSSLEALETLDQGEVLNGPYVSMDHNDDQLECLGVAPYLIRREETGSRRFENLIQPDTAFAKLPRPVTLPVVCPIVTKNADCQELANKLWNFHCQFTVEGSIPRSRADPLKILLVVWKSKAVSAQIAICYRLLPGGKIYFERNFSNSLASFLDVEQMFLLSIRFMHHFLREVGWMLPWLFIESIAETIHGVWSQSKQYRKLVLDLAIIKADLLYNIPSSKFTEKLTNEVSVIANAMTALGHFQLSEEICVELARSDKMTAFQRAQALLGASMSCYHVVRYNAALDLVLCSLRIMTKVKETNFDWNQGLPLQAIHHLLATHSCIFRNEAREHYGGNGRDKVESEGKAFISLLCLISKSSFARSEDYIPKHVAVGLICGLKPVYREPKNADQQLLQAFKSDSCETFRETLIDALQPGDMFLGEGLETSFATGDVQTRRREGKRLATKHIKNNPASVPRRACNNCEMVEPPNEMFKICQCRLVCFCSKECQVENWKDHKNACPWNLERKLHKKKSG